MANRAYTAGLELLAEANLNWATADVRVLMLDNAGTYEFDPDHEFVDDLSPAANELDGPGYDRQVLANKSVSKVLATDQVELHADPVIFEDLDAGEAQAIVVFLHVTDDTDSVLISYHDGGFPKVSNGEDFTVNWAGGTQTRMFRLTSPIE